MTNELEKQFFDTFGIEPKSIKRTLKLAMQGYDESDLPEDLKQFIRSQTQVYNVYPQISDHILLELLVIMTRYADIIDGFDSVQELKEFVLKELMYSLTQPECNIVKRQVRTLFEERKNDR